MKYYIITFGCQMNKSDSERIATVLEKTGYKSASNINEADLIVVNMCSVRQSAVDRVYGLASRFKKLRTKNYQLRTVLTGCILKRDKRKFEKQFDLILNIKALPNWQKHLSHFSDDRRKVMISCRDYLKIQPKYSNNFSAFVPISNGCNNFCAYCVVPYTRGPLICRPAQEILDEVKELIKKGYKEIWLLGQNVNSYSWNMKHETHNSIGFPKLLRMINNVPGDFWIRFTSSHPKDFSNELIRTVAQCEKVTEYINLPIQSGDNKVLKKMNRPYTVEHYKNLVEKIRQVIPNVCLSTDVIVGFPGETKKQFENTVSLFKEMKFDMAYIAEYSPRPVREYKKSNGGKNYHFSNGARPGTLAFKMKDDVPKKEKERRRKVLTEILKQTALENNKKYIGKVIDALIMKHETYNMKHFCIGKTRTYKTIKFQVSGSMFQGLVGQFIKLKVTHALPWGLKGEILK